MFPRGHCRHEQSFRLLARAPSRPPGASRRTADQARQGQGFCHAPNGSGAWCASRSAGADNGQSPGRRFPPGRDEVWQRRNILGKCPIINFPGKNLNPPAFGRERMGNRVSRFLCKSHIRRQRFIAVNAVWLGFIVGRQFRFLFPQIIINRPEPLIGRPAEGKCFVQSQFFCDPRTASHIQTCSPRPACRPD